jgi:hypothetical protein
MTTTSPTFGIDLSNVPIANLRSEFRVHYRLAHDGKLLPSRNQRRPLQTPYFVWLGMPESGLTLLVVRSILSLEAYMSFAAEFEGAARGHLSSDFRRAARNPFSLGRGTADSYYNRLPKLIEADLPMSVSAPDLWKTTKSFYTELRNPLMHGHELRDVSNEQVSSLFVQMGNVYRWIDSWFTVETFMPGAKKAFVFD